MMNFIKKIPYLDYRAIYLLFVVMWFVYGVSSLLTGQTIVNNLVLSDTYQLTNAIAMIVISLVGFAGMYRSHNRLILVFCVFTLYKCIEMLAKTLILNGAAYSMWVHCAISLVFSLLMLYNKVIEIISRASINDSK